MGLLAAMNTVDVPKVEFIQTQWPFQMGLQWDCNPSNPQIKWKTQSRSESMVNIFLWFFSKSTILSLVQCLCTSIAHLEIWRKEEKERQIPRFWVSVTCNTRVACSLWLCNCSPRSKWQLWSHPSAVKSR